MSPRLHLTLVVAIVAVLVRPGAAARLDILRSVGGLAPHVVGLFEEPVGFQQSAKGTYYVFDRRGHAVYTVAPDFRRWNGRSVAGTGAVRPVEVQPAGGRAMAWADWLRGRRHRDSSQHRDQRPRQQQRAKHQDH